jgi:hypothetical protein
MVNCGNLFGGASCIAHREMSLAERAPHKNMLINKDLYYLSESKAGDKRIIWNCGAKLQGVFHIFFHKEPVKKPGFPERTNGEYFVPLTNTNSGTKAPPGGALMNVAYRP